MEEKAVVFDIYGTMVDINTDEESDLFWHRFAKYTKRYHKFDWQELKKLYKKYVDELLLKDEEIEIIDAFKKMFNADTKQIKKIAYKFRRLSTKYIRLYPKMIKLLKILKKNNYKLFILSNAQESFTLPELKKLKIYKYFDQIAISSNYKIKKPNKEFYLKALSAFKVKKAYMIGNDYECDIKPALELGLKPIFIKSNLTPKDQFKHYGLDGFDYLKILSLVGVN